MSLPDRTLCDLAEKKGCVQVIFFVETVSGSMLRSGYFLRLYFWIDALATVCPACLSAAVGRGSRLLHCTAAIPVPAARAVATRGWPSPFFWSPQARQQH